MAAVAIQTYADKKRIAPRYEFSALEITPIRVAGMHEHECSLAYIKNLSWSGLCLKAPAKHAKKFFEDLMKNNQFVDHKNRLAVDATNVVDMNHLKVGDKLRLEMAPLNAPPMSLIAEVIRVEHKDDEIYYGVKFCDAPFIYLERLARQVHEAIASKAEQENRLFELEEEQKGLKRKLKLLGWLTLAFGVMATLSIFSF